MSGYIYDKTCECKGNSMTFIILDMSGYINIYDKTCNCIKNSMTFII